MTDEFRLYEAAELRKDGYPKAWHDTLKHRVRADAGHRCIRCGHPYLNGQHGNGEWSPCDTGCTHGGPVRWAVMNGPWSVGGVDGAVGQEIEFETGGRVFQAQWRILTVHHLDGNKANCRWWNLVALCQRCHLQIQNKVQMARIYPWPHSEWFKPYVAAYYAFVYLGEDLSREETMVRMDELLGLELAVE